MTFDHEDEDGAGPPNEGTDANPYRDTNPPPATSAVPRNHSQNSDATAPPSGDGELKILKLIRGEILEPPPRPAAPPPVLDDDYKRRAWAYIEGICRNQALCPKGQRNDQQNSSSFKAFRIALGAGIPLDAVEDVIFQAQCANGQVADDGEHQVRGSIHSARQGAERAGPDYLEDRPHEPLQPAHTLDTPSGGGAQDGGGDGGELLTAEQIRENRIAHKLDELAVTREARRRLDAAERPPITLPAVRNLTQFLDTEHDEPEYLIDRIHPYGGNILATGPYKAGKTTLRDNAIRALVDGGAFLGRYNVTRTVNRLVIIDLEMSEAQLWRWFQRSGIRNTDNVADVISLQGRGHMLDLRDDDLRRQWVDRLQTIGCDYLIVDCLRPVLDAVGLDENREASLWLQAFDRLRAEAGIRDGAMVLHHHGHGSDRGRGDSAILGWYTAEWKVTRLDKDDVSSPREFSANGRDVDEPPRALRYNEATRALALEDHSVKGCGSRDRAEEDAAAILDAAAAEPDGITTTDGRKIVGNSSRRWDAATTLLLNRGEIRREDGRRNGKACTAWKLTRPCEVCGKALRAGQEGRHLVCWNGPAGSAEEACVDRSGVHAETAGQEVFPL